MEITVKMTPEEFQGFMEYRKEKGIFENEIKRANEKAAFFAHKTCWALGQDANGKTKIIDKEHAAELLEMASDYLA